MKYMNCVLLCKSYRSSILTYAIVIAGGAKTWNKKCVWEREKERNEWKGKKEKTKRMNERNACGGEGEKKCDCGVVMYGSRKSFLRAYRERRRCARCPDCTLSRIRNDKGNVKNETWRSARRRSKVKQRIEQWDTARWCKVLSIMGLRAYM